MLLCDSWKVGVLSSLKGVQLEMPVVEPTSSHDLPLAACVAAYVFWCATCETSCEHHKG